MRTSFSNFSITSLCLQCSPLLVGMGKVFSSSSSSSDDENCRCFLHVSGGVIGRLSSIWLLTILEANIATVLTKSWKCRLSNSNFLTVVGLYLHAILPTFTAMTTIWLGERNFGRGDRASTVIFKFSSTWTSWRFLGNFLRSQCADTAVAG